MSAAAVASPGHPYGAVVHSHHGHRNGVVDGCAKCAALQKYGAVLQEIRTVAPTADAKDMPVTAKLSQGGSNEGVPKTDSASGDRRDSTEKVNVTVAAVSDAAIGQGERQMEKKAVLANKGKTINGDKSGASSISHREKMGRTKMDNLLKVRAKGDGECRVAKLQSNHRSKFTRPMKGSADRSADKKEGSVAVKSRRKGMVKRARVADSGSRRTEVSCDEEENRGGRSPEVDCYSASEQREIYDAVQSLQILAKRSSSPLSSASSTTIMKKDGGEEERKSCKPRKA